MVKLIKLRRKMVVLFFLFIPCSILLGNESDLYRLVESYYKNSNYYSAITEAKRYQFLYPEGKYYVDTTILLGKSYFKGKNYNLGAQVMAAHYEENKNTPAGEAALAYLINMRVMQGFPIFALSRINEYRTSYSRGKYIEKVDLGSCYAVALSRNFQDTVEEIEQFRNKYPKSGYSEELDELHSVVTDEMGRTKKSLAVAVMGSLLIPGFGYFYTGKYFLGIVTFLTNALFGYLIYNGVQNRDTFQIIFFSIVELSFYQYSIYGAMRSVYEYNSMRDYSRRVRLSFGTSF